MTRETHESIAERHYTSRKTVGEWNKKGVDIYDDEAIQAYREKVGSFQAVPPKPRAKENGGGDKTIREQIEVEQLRKIKLENEKLELSISVTEGNHYPKHEFEEGWAEVAALMDMMAAEQVSSFPGTIPGMDGPAVEKEVREFWGKWHEKFDGKKDAEVQRFLDRIVKDTRGDLKKVAEGKRKRNKS